MRRRFVLAMIVAAVGAATLNAVAGTPSAAPPRFDHVVEVFLENEGATATFEDPSAAPRLVALEREGLYLPNYYGVGHASLDNYIAAFSAEQPIPQTEADCLGMPYQSCIYPASVPTLGALLDRAHLSWRVYSEGMTGAPGGHNCLHAPVRQLPDPYQGPGAGGYATRHNPAPWFDSVLTHGGSEAYCQSHNVDLTRLWTDARSSRTLPAWSFVQPDTCHDGHDDSAAEGGCTFDPEGPSAATGVAAIDAWLPGFVHRLTTSRAWDARSLLVITFDEGSDNTGCRPCRDGSAGGRVGALLIGGAIARPGAVDRAWHGDHYAMLRTFEAAWGLPTLKSRAVSRAAAATVHDGDPGVHPLTNVWRVN